MVQLARCGYGAEERSEPAFRGPGRPARADRESGSAKLAAATGARTELDVRGKRFVEASRSSSSGSTSRCWPVHRRCGSFTQGHRPLGARSAAVPARAPHVKDVRFGNPEEGERRDRVRTVVTMTASPGAAAREAAQAFATAANTSRR